MFISRCLSKNHSLQILTNLLWVHESQLTVFTPHLTMVHHVPAAWIYKISGNQIKSLCVLLIDVLSVWLTDGILPDLYIFLTRKTSICHSWNRLKRFEKTDPKCLQAFDRSELTGKGEDCEPVCSFPCRIVLFLTQIWCVWNCKQPKPKPLLRHIQQMMQHGNISTALLPLNIFQTQNSKGQRVVLEKKIQTQKFNI